MMLEVMMRSVPRVLILLIMMCLTAAAQEQLKESPGQSANANASEPATTNQPASDIPSQPSPAQPSPTQPSHTQPNPTQPSKDAPTQVSGIAERVFSQEARLVENMHHYTPLVETYIQNLKPDPDFATVPGSDRYFLGRFLLDPKRVNGRAFKDNNRSAFMYQVLDRLDSFFRLNYQHIGFLEMVFLNYHFDKTHSLHI